MKKSYISLSISMLSLLTSCGTSLSSTSTSSQPSQEPSTTKVGEPMTLDKTISNFTQSGYSLSFDVDGALFSNHRGKVAYEVDYYPSSISFKANNTSVYVDDFGYGMDNNEEEGRIFEYSISNGSITSATYLRDQSKDLSDYVAGLSSLDEDYYDDVKRKESNKYICEADDVVNIFSKMATQFLNTSKSSYSTALSDAIEDYGSYAYVEFNVLDSISFNVYLRFVSIDYETGDESVEGSLVYKFKADHTGLSDSLLDAYLENSTPSSPATNETFLSLYNLSKGYNYTLDLGYSGGKSLGTFYCTKDYCYYDLTEAGRKSYGKDQNYGYKNEEDGVYLFTVSDNVVTKESRIMKKGVPYTHWYEFEDNLYSSLKKLESDFYTFEEMTSTYSSYSDIEGKEIGSYSKSCVDYASNLFKTALSTGMRTAKGLMLNIDYDDKTISNTTMMFGLIYDYTGESYDVSGVIYTNCFYSNFGSTSVSILE